MEGVDVIRQAGEEAALDWDKQDMDDLASQLLPEYETEVMEEGEIPMGPGEYPGSVKDSPPHKPDREINCPIHNVPLQYKTSERGWSYTQCDEPGCPLWCAKDNTTAICFEWIYQASDDVKEGPYTCYCDRPYQLKICQKSDKGNQGRLFLACRQVPQCRFFQWADDPRERKYIRAFHEVRGGTYSRENRLRRENPTPRQRLVNEAYAKPVTPYQHPLRVKECPGFQSPSRGKRPQPRVKQQETQRYDRVKREIRYDTPRDSRPPHPQDDRQRYPTPEEVEVAMQRRGFTDEAYKRYSLSSW